MPYSHISGWFYFEKLPDLSYIIEYANYLMKYCRMRSVPVKEPNNNHFKYVDVDINSHIKELSVDSTEELNELVNKYTCNINLPKEKPLWEIIMINNK